jgi:hypothetical protein
MKIAAHEPRCADALDKGCPDRKVCARWVLRRYNERPDTPWANFADCRTDRGCRSIMRLEAVRER